MRHDYNINTMNTKREEDKRFGLDKFRHEECKETGLIIEKIRTAYNFVEKIIVNF